MQKGEQMDDLISRQAAIEKISETIWDTAVANDVKTILKELPSAQPDIIRCRNCKYYCGRSCMAHDMPGDYLTPDDFCSWAQPNKRKE